MSATPPDKPAGMRPTIHRAIQEAHLPPGTVVAIGNYDGVHLGHQAVLDQALSLARETPGDHQVAVLTFDPHPAKLFAPELDRYDIGLPMGSIVGVVAHGPS